MLAEFIGSMEIGNPFVLIDVLLRHDVPLVVIGGHAVAYHGYLRATEDVDIVFRRTSDTESSLLAALHEVKAYWISDELDDATGLERTHAVTREFIASSHLMMLGTDYGYLDLFDFVPGFPSVPVEELIASADRATGRPFVSLQWLRRLKAATARHKDLDDLEHLPE